MKVIPMGKQSHNTWYKRLFILLVSAVLLCANNLFIGVNALALGETIGDIEEYNKLIKENLDDYYLVYLRGSIYRDSEQWDAAIRDYSAALAFVDEGREPPKWTPYDNDDVILALILMGLGQAYSSIEDYILSNNYLNRLENDEDAFKKLTVDQQMYIRVLMAYNNWNIGNIQDALIQYHDNLLEEDVVKNPSKDKRDYFINSVNYAQYMMFYLDKPKVNGYLLIYMDLQAIAEVLEADTLKSFFYPLSEKERYLQGTLYLSTGMYGQATEIFSYMLNSDLNDLPREERNTLQASCLIGLGKASFMQQEKPIQEIKAYFDQAEPLINDVRCDMLVDFLYWKSKLLFAMGDAEGFLDCMETIAKHPGIALLKDDVSKAYVEAALATVNQ